VGVTDGRGPVLYSDDVHPHEISRTVHTHLLSGLWFDNQTLRHSTYQTDFRQLFVEYRPGVRFKMC